MSQFAQKARLLLEQNNYDQAEQYALSGLEEDPQSAEIMAILALCLSHKGKAKEAKQAAQDAIGLEPDWAYVYFVQACVAHDHADLKLAIEASLKALEIDPNQAVCFGILANAYLRQKKFDLAEKYARSGLELDPEEQFCRMALTNVFSIKGNSAEADLLAQESLSMNPDDSTSFSTKGWVCLRQGMHQEATEAFREALRMDPNSEHARSGIVEAIKARNPLYRGFLQYMNWLGRLSSNAQWGMYIGIFVFFRAFKFVAESYPNLLPVYFVLLACYVFFIYTTWTAAGLFNVMLYLHPLGRYALNRYEKTISLTMLSFVSVGICLIVLGLLMSNFNLACFGGALFGMGIPLAALYSSEKKSNQLIFAAEVVVLTLIAVVALLMSHVDSEWMSLYSLILFAIFASTWLNSFLLGKEQ